MARRELTQAAIDSTLSSDTAALGRFNTRAILHDDPRGPASAAKSAALAARRFAVGAPLRPRVVPAIAGNEAHLGFALHGVITLRTGDIHVHATDHAIAVQHGFALALGRAAVLLATEFIAGSVAVSRTVAGSYCMRLGMTGLSCAAIADLMQMRGAPPPPAPAPPDRAW